MVQRGIKVLRLLFFTPLNLITALDYRLTGKHPRMANLTRILGGLFILCLAVVIPSTHTLDRQWCCYSSDTGWCVSSLPVYARDGSKTHPGTTGTT